MKRDAYKLLSEKYQVVSESVAKGSTDLVQIEYWQQDTMESGRWVKTKPMPRATAEKIIDSFYRGEIVNVEQGVTESSTEVDMKGKKCIACKKGTYQETEIDDDMHGTLHCTKCNKQVARWQEPKKKGVTEASASVAEEFDDILTQADFPKSDYDTAEIMNLIHNYIKGLDPRDVDSRVFAQIKMALGWKEIDPGILDDYLQDKAGASGPDSRDPQIDETTGNQVYASVAKMIEANPNINSIEIQSHYGNMVLPVVEIWKQNGIIKISVEIPEQI